MAERSITIFKTRAVSGTMNAWAELTGIAERARETGELIGFGGVPISRDCLPSINEQLAYWGERPIELRAPLLTVSQLIAELSKYPGDMPVQMHVGGDDYYAQTDEVSCVEFRTMLGDRQNPGLFLLDELPFLEGTDQKFPPELAARCNGESCGHLGAAHDDRKGCHVFGCNCAAFVRPPPNGFATRAADRIDWEDTLP